MPSLRKYRSKSKKRSTRRGGFNELFGGKRSRVSKRSKHSKRSSKKGGASSSKKPRKFRLFNW